MDSIENRLPPNSRKIVDLLMNAGVHLYCYQPGMLHAKLISIDRQLAVVGSANMDMQTNNQR